MLEHDGKVPKNFRAEFAGQDRSSANIKMLLIATAFLFVTIGLILILPGNNPGGQSDTAMSAEPTLASPTAEVSRADASLLELESTPSTQAVSRQLRQPIRLTDSNANHSDLYKMTAMVLIDFGYAPRPDDRLVTLLVQALSEGQSNAYIDALLNTAAARGEFKPPRQLVMSTGRMDTEALLLALVRQSQRQG